MADTYRKRKDTKRKKIWVFGGGSTIAFFLLLLGMNQYGIDLSVSGDINCTDCNSYFNISVQEYSLCFGSSFIEPYVVPEVPTDLWIKRHQEPKQQRCTYGRTYLQWEHVEDDLYFCPSSTKQDDVTLQYARCTRLSGTGKTCYKKEGDHWLPADKMQSQCLGTGVHEFKLHGTKEPEEIVKWGVRYRNVDEDPLWLEEKSKKSGPSTVFSGGMDRWVITKTHTESQLDVNADILNSTASEFCMIDKTGNYKTASNVLNRDVSKIPINKLSSNDSLSIKGSEIDFSKTAQREQKCFTVEYAEFKPGMSFSFGFGTVVVNSTQEGFDNLASWNSRVLYDPNNENWWIMYIDSGSDIHSTYSNDNGSTWNDGVDIDAATYSYDSFDCLMDTPNSSASYIHCTYANGAQETVFYRRCEVNITDMICGTEESAFVSSAQGGGASDNTFKPRITMDENRCLLIAFGMQDDDVAAATQYGLNLIKENSTTVCGDGDWDGATDTASGYPILNIQSESGYQRNFCLGITSFGDEDVQLSWVDQNVTSSYDLETVYFNGTSASVGTQRTLDTDIEGLTYVCSQDTSINNDVVVVFGMDDGTNDVDAYTILSKDGALDSQDDTGINGVHDSLATDIMASVVDTRSENNDMWIFSVDNTDAEDIYYAISNSTSNYQTWYNQTLWQDDPDATDEIKYVDAYFDNTTCDIMVKWLANSASPFSVTVDTINTGSCVPTGSTPTWSSNSTNNTIAGLSTLFSIKWENNNTENLSTYIFEWHNGSNWTRTNNTADLETGTQTFEGELIDPVDLTAQTCTGYWGSDCGLACNVPELDNTLDACTTCAGGATDDHVDQVAVNGTVFAVNASINITCTYDPFSSGTELYTFIKYPNGTYSQLWTASAAGGGIESHTEIFNDTSQTGQYVARCIADWDGTGASCASGSWYDNDDTPFNITDAAPASDTDTNKTAVEYSDLVDSYSTIDNITVIVNVSYYNTSGSIANGNTNATLWLEIYNGTDWIDSGDLQVNQTGNFTEIYTGLVDWTSLTDRDIRISARYLDYNDSSNFDTINWTATWATVVSNQELVNDSAVSFTQAMCEGSTNKTVCWSNVTKTISSTVGDTIKWRIHANNIINNWNQTDLFEFTTTSVPSLTIEFVSPTLPNNSYTNSTQWVEINASISNAADLDSVIYNWDGTNYSMMDDDLIFFMNLDNISSLGESNSVAVDLSNQGNNGTPTNGAAPTTSGYYRGAYDFDGSDDFINMSDVLDPGTTDFSFGAWFKPGTHSTTATIMSKGSLGPVIGYSMYVSAAGLPGTQIRNGGTLAFFNGATNTSDGNWHFMLVTVNRSSASGLNLYLDGVSEGTADGVLSGLTLSSANGLAIGTRMRAGSTNAFYFNGSIDEVRIWNKSLTAAEVYQQYVSDLQKFNSTQWYLYVNQTKDATSLLDNGTYTHQTFVSNSTGSWNSTDLRTVNVGEAPFLTWSDSETNLTTTTPENSSVYFNVTLSDANPDSYIFSWYNGTDWANDSAVAYSNGEEVSVIKNITIDEGDINWTWYFNNTAGNSTQTDIFSVTLVTAAIPSIFNISFVDPTLPNNSFTNSIRWVEVNVSIANISEMSSVIYNWNETNTNLLDSTLLFFYNLNNYSALGESNTFVKDATPRSNDGTVVSATSTTNGKFAGAFDFNGVNDYIYINDSADQEWQMIGGDGILSSWANNTYESVHALEVCNGKLYAGLGFSTGDSEVWEYDWSTWTKVGGDGVNNSWAAATYEWVYALQCYQDDLYAGLAWSTGDAEVWKYDATGWTMIGGDGVLSSWANNTYERTTAKMAVYNDTLITGLAQDPGDAETWQWDGSIWTKIGGDELYGSWANSTYQMAYSHFTFDGKLYTGLGWTQNNSDIFEYNGTGWRQVAGDGLFGSWNGSDFAYVMEEFMGKLHVGIGANAEEGELWRWDNPNWTQIGGDNLSGSWGSEYEFVTSLSVIDGEMIIGLGNDDGDADMYAYYGDQFTKIGGDGERGSWTSGTKEYTQLCINYNKTHYCATSTVKAGGTAGDAEVWSYKRGLSFGDGNNDTPFTVELWANLSNVTNSGLIAKGTDLVAGTLEWVFNFAGDDKIYFVIYDNYTIASELVSTNDTLETIEGTWTHLVGVYDGCSDASCMRIYMDGVELATTPSSAGSYVAMHNTNTPVTVGVALKDHATFKRYTKGTLDEVKLWGRNLSQSDIEQSYMSNLYKYDTDDWILYVNQTKNTTDLLDDGTYTYQVTVSNSTFYNQTEQRTFTIDASNPTWSDNETNLTVNTPNGASVYFNITLSDANPDSYVFSFYNGSDWINDSAVSYTDGEEIQVTKTININSGTVNWTWYFNDSASNSNQSDVWTTELILVNYNFTYLVNSSLITTFKYLNGTLTNVLFDESILAMKLNSSASSNGSYLSEILNVSTNVTWNNISWNSNIGELPDNQADNSEGNMTGNVLLLHFNNDSGVGENTTFVYDSSGQGNNGTWGNSTTGDIDYVTGKFDLGIQFDGVDDYIDLDGINSSWLQVGGDEISGSWQNDSYEFAYTPIVFEDKLYVGLGANPGDAEVWEYNGSTWTMVGGDGLFTSWANNSYGLVHMLVVHNETMYAGLSSGTGDAEVWRWDNPNWTIVGGNGLFESWANETYEYVLSMVSWDGNLYASLGASVGDAEVWRWDEPNWTMVGGDGILDSWANNTYEYLQELHVFEDKLYTGISSIIAGGTPGHAEVWEYNKSTWRMVGGDGLFNSWANNTYETANSFAEYDGKLHVGLAITAGNSEVWRWDNPNWTKIGGDELHNSWANSTYEFAYSMEAYGDRLYVSLGWSAGDAELWEWNGAYWNKIGGDGLFDSWANNTYGRLSNHMPKYNGDIHVGLLKIGGVGTAEVWKYNEELDVLDELSGTTTGTWGAWVKPVNATPAVAEILMSFGDTDALEFINIFIQTTGVFRATAYKEGTAQWDIDTDANHFSDGEWAYVTLVQNGTSPILYINGVEVNQTFIVSTNTEVWFSNLTGIDNSRIGDRNINSGGEALFFNGTMDEVAIWNRALSAQEILDIYRRGAVSLNFSVRSCDDAACSGESFIDINDTSPQLNINTVYGVSDNKWFQYNVSFETDNIGFSPELFNVTIGYSEVLVGNLSINLSFGPVGISVFRYETCGPDFENASAVPQGQNTTHGIDYICNNGTLGAGDIQIKISGVLNPNWTWWASNTSILTNLLNLNTSWQTIYSQLGEGSCTYIWHVANCSYTNQRPGAYEQYQII